MCDSINFHVSMDEALSPGEKGRRAIKKEFLLKTFPFLSVFFLFHNVFKRVNKFSLLGKFCELGDRVLVI